MIFCVFSFGESRVEETEEYRTFLKQIISIIKNTRKNYICASGTLKLEIKSLKQATGEVGPRCAQGEEEEPSLDFEKFPLGFQLSLASYHACAAAHQYDEIYIADQDGAITDHWKRCPGRQ